MEKFSPDDADRDCPKCGQFGGHEVRFTGTALEVKCRRCSASLGTYLPMDAPEPKQPPNFRDVAKKWGASLGRSNAVA